MGSIYRPKYKNAAGEVLESAVWWLKYRANGRPVRESSGTTKETKARGMLRVKEGDAERGLPVTPKVNRKTVNDLLDDVLTDYRNKEHDTLKETEGRMTNHLRPFFGTWNAASVSDEQVRAYRSHRMAEDAALATINRELSALRRGYNLNKRTVTVSPDFDLPAEKNARQGFFEREAFGAVRAALPAELRPLLTVAYITGWRAQSELLPMEWRQVDFPARVVRLEPGTTKNDEGREFAFTRDLEEALRVQRAYSDRVEHDRAMVCRWVFHRKGKRIRTWRRRWLTALLTVGLAHREAHEDGTPNPRGTIIAHVVPHDFRRTAIRNLARAGVAEAVAMKMCGHETRSVFDRYNIVTGDDMRNAAAKLDAATAAAGTVPGTVTSLESFSRPAEGAK